MGSIRSRPDMTIMVDWVLKTDYLSSPSVAVERQLTAGALSLRKKKVCATSMNECRPGHTSLWPPTALFHKTASAF